MGASNSKLEEDKALQLCRERKKFVRQALDGRCNLAATHIAYIESLKITGTALRRFVEPDVPIESSIYTSTNATPEPLPLTEKSLSQFSFSSPSISRRVDATDNILPSPSPPTSSRYHVNHMKFRGTFSRKVEEKPAVPVTVSVTSSTPQNSTPRSIERPEASPFEASPFEAPPFPSETSPWDFFGLGHAIDNHFTAQDGRTEYGNDTRHLGDEDRVPASEDEDEHYSSPGREGSQVSDDEFDEPSTETLVRTFENVNRTTDHASNSGSPDITSARRVLSEAKSLNGEISKSPDLSPLRPAPSGLNGEKRKSPDLSPLRPTPSGLNGEKSKSPDLSPLIASPSGPAVDDDMKTPVKDDDIENKVAPKDFFLSMRDIEYLFIKASGSGREVPRMLEANKFHFRPIFPGKESGSMTRTLMKSCFSCGDDPSQIPEEPPQTSVKYLTWHRSTSSHASSPTRHGVHSAHDFEDVTDNLFDNFCMVSGSHASTLDRLFAWEKKLYDEVKVSEMIRSDYDAKRKLLRQLESKVESPQRVDKTRALVKDLHSRIGVAIHRINSISRKIEEIRDKELQPQLEELIEGLRRMWEVMFNCHKLQLHVISIAHSPGNMKILIQSDFRRQIAIHLQNELSSLSSSFTKWIVSQKAYVDAINKWLHKCVSLPQKSSRRKRRMQPPQLRNHGPPIYTTCSVWLEMFDSLPTKEVSDAMKGLAAEISHFLPRQEKNQGKGAKHSHPDLTPLRDDSAEDWTTGFDRFRTSLAFFLGQLNNFSESSVKMFTELQKAIQEAKYSYTLHVNSQSQSQS